jgi:hypothetical protein
MNDCCPTWTKVDVIDISEDPSSEHDDAKFISVDSTFSEENVTSNVLDTAELKVVM